MLLLNVVVVVVVEGWFFLWPTKMRLSPQFDGWRVCVMFTFSKRVCATFVACQKEESKSQKYVSNWSADVLLRNSKCVVLGGTGRDGTAGRK